MQLRAADAALAFALAITLPAGAQATAPAPAPADVPPPPIADGAPAPAPGHDNGETLWPQAATVDGITYTLFTPQFQAIDGTRATCRAAFSIARPPAGAANSAGANTEATAHYGVASFSADLDADASAGILEVSNMAITQVRLADAGDVAATQAQLQGMLAGATFTVDRAVALHGMQVAKDRAASRPALSNAPPEIRVTTRPSVLLLLDGPPVLRDVGAGVGIAQNTPSILAFDKGSRTWFTRVGAGTWLSSTRWRGPFVAGKSPSPDALRAIDAALPKRHPDASAAPAPPAGKVPDVVVSATPLCLVSIDGDPSLRQVADGLSAVTNANCDLFQTADGAWWLLASGRWFTTIGLATGPWNYVKPDALPAAFAQIDPHGSWGNVLANVPGTPAATDALYQQSVPHSATLDRTKAAPKLTTLGGPTRFAAIAGTALQYATNTNDPLILCDGAYYLCENAAWFKGPAANGPWALCDSVPEAIYAIPPSCPVYNVTFVQVLDATPDTVTFGFTAGYMNSYENDGTVAYGTGYRYPGTVGHREVTDSIGDNSEVTDDDTWDSYGGWPSTYGYWPSYGCAYGGWGFCGYPGWGCYGLGCGPYWGGSGWWGGGRGLGTGFALGMGFANAWDWGYHPWGSRDGGGWWNNHWSGAYRRGWDNAARGYNRAGAAADMNAYARNGGGGMAAAQTASSRVEGATAGVPDANVPGLGSASGAWKHAAVANNVVASRDGQVMQQRGGQMYARSGGSWQRASASGAATAETAGAPAGNSGGWRAGAAAAHQRSGGANFRESDGSGAAAVAARDASMDGFRPDPNHNFDGSPRGAFARGDTNYAGRGAQAWGPSGSGSTAGNYQRGGSWNGGGWGVGDQGGTPAQRWGNDYDRGMRGFNQDTGWTDRTASRPANPYGYGYSGWANGNRGYSSASRWNGGRPGGAAHGGGGRR